jgi:hypothetical protein
MENKNKAKTNKISQIKQYKKAIEKYNAVSGLVKKDAKIGEIISLLLDVKQSDTLSVTIKVLTENLNSVKAFLKAFIDVRQTGGESDAIYKSMNATYYFVEQNKTSKACKLAELLTSRKIDMSNFSVNLSKCLMDENTNLSILKNIYKFLS